jgi:hypothetical protein
MFTSSWKMKTFAQWLWDKPFTQYFPEFISVVIVTSIIGCFVSLMTNLPVPPVLEILCVLFVLAIIRLILGAFEVAKYQSESSDSWLGKRNQEHE